ncbi:MAG: YmfQ family protein [Treponema sp.]|nr:YmfQ family protein [Treponema sp.]
MGIASASLEQYETAVKKLFPQGQYWDRQFADPQSDVSLFAKAKAAEIFRFRHRMGELHDESRIETSAELLGDWERVLLGAIHHGLDTEQRRGLLLAASVGNFNVDAIKKTGRVFGITVTDVRFPYRPAFFGHSRFGIDPIASPAAFSVLFVCASQAQESVRHEFEKQLLSTILSSYIVHFIYGGD